jgi:hypothetical protein
MSDLRAEATPTVDPWATHLAAARQLPPVAGKVTPDPEATPDPYLLLRQEQVAGLIERANLCRCQLDENGNWDSFPGGFPLDVVVMSPDRPTITLSITKDGHIAFRLDLAMFRFIRAELDRVASEEAA